MTIWLLAVLLIASTAGLGLKYGAVRAACTFTGILFAALLAPAVAHLIRPLLALASLKNPLWLWILGPTIAFVFVWGLFKIGGLAAQRKVEVFFKYQAGDLRLALWNRLNNRVGLCLGILNGAAYLILVSFVIYNATYWTYQMANPDADSFALRTLNRLGKDLHGSGLHRAAANVFRMSPAFYRSADAAGLMYHTPQLDYRLSRYPAFLVIGEDPGLKDIRSTEFSDFFQKQPSLSALLKAPQVKTTLGNPELLKDIWAATKPNAADLVTFLESGRSEKFVNEKLLGRWGFDVNGAIALTRRVRTNLTSIEVQRLRRAMRATYSNTYLVAAPDQTVLLCNFPRVRAVPGSTPVTELQTISGQWKSVGDRYMIAFTSENHTEEAPAEMEGNRLLIPTQGFGAMAFLRED